MSDKDKKVFKLLGGIFALTGSLMLGVALWTGTRQYITFTAGFTPEFFLLPIISGGLGLAFVTMGVVFLMKFGRIPKVLCPVCGKPVERTRHLCPACAAPLTGLRGD